jgi:hypothetical protein
VWQLWYLRRSGRLPEGQVSQYRSHRSSPTTQEGAQQRVTNVNGHISALVIKGIGVKGVKGVKGLPMEIELRTDRSLTIRGVLHEHLQKNLGQAANIQCMAYGKLIPDDLELMARNFPEWDGTDTFVLYVLEMLSSPTTPPLFSSLRRSFGFFRELPEERNSDPNKWAGKAATGADFFIRWEHGRRPRPGFRF